MLLPLLYDELRKLAHSQVNGEAGEHSLSPTALVHEAYMRLAQLREDNAVWSDRVELMKAASGTMRRILIERARARGRQKRGANAERTELTESMVIAPAEDEQLLAVNEVLEELSAINPEAAEIVQMRFFGGFSLQEIAETNQVSYRTVKRRWAYARAWLRARLSE